MEIKAVRVFYRKLDSKIVWAHTLMEPGEFPTTIEQDLAELPNVVISQELDANLNVISETKLGGSSKDYACIEVTEKASDFLASDTNTIVDGALVIGLPRVIPVPIPPRNLAAEIDEIKKATGIGSAGQTGIAARIDNQDTRLTNLEARIAKLEV